MKENKNFDVAQVIEHTNVNPIATEHDIKKLCQQAEKYNFYAVCVSSSRVLLAKKLLSKTRIKIVCTVGFPHSTCTTYIKVRETKQAIKNGADEIDMVINIAGLKDKEYSQVLEDIQAVVQVASYKPVKVILEVGYLTRQEIKKAVQIVMKAGAHFVKTCTGYGPRGTKVHDIRFLSSLTQHKIGIKASGGIADYLTAVKMLNAGADRIGTSHGVDIVRKRKNKKSLIKTY